MKTFDLTRCIGQLLDYLPTDANALKDALSACETKSDLLRWVAEDLMIDPVLWQRCAPLLHQFGLLDRSLCGALVEIPLSPNAAVLRNDLVIYLKGMGIEVTTDWHQAQALLDRNGVVPIADLHHQVCGLLCGRVIYVNPTIADLATPIHEYTHLWAKSMQLGNPTEWAHIVELFRNASQWDDAKHRYAYLHTDAEIVEELLADYSGKQGATLLHGLEQGIGHQATAQGCSLLGDLAHIRLALRHFWQEVADFLHIHYTEPTEVASQVLRDFLTGVNPLGEGQSAERLPNLSVGIRYELATDGAIEAAFTPEMQSILKRAKAEGTLGMAPNGKRSNLDLRQWLMVRTEAFKAWFGDWETNPEQASQVVDENGEPKVVFHGTTQGGFSVFENELASKHSWSPVGAIWFSGDRERAYSYAGTYNEVDTFDPDLEEPGIYSCFLNVRQPVFADFDGADWQGIGHELYELRKEDEAGNFVEMVESPEGLDYFKSGEAAEEEAERLGLEYYSIHNNHWLGTNVDTEAAMVLDDHMGDGLLIYNVIDNGRYGGDEVGDDYVVFSPYQIKSAACNMGRFDPQEADIRYQLLNQTAALSSPAVVKALASEIYHALLHERTVMEEQWLQRTAVALHGGVTDHLSAESNQFVQAYSALCRLADRANQLRHDSEIARNLCVSKGRGR